MVAALPDLVRKRIERAGIGLNSASLSALAVYLGLLTKWNVTVNLTALALNPASDEAIDRLLVEPLLAAKVLGAHVGWQRNATPLRFVDVGSGGGSPAIPLAVALGADGPVELRMVESKTRKAAFLRDAVRQVPLPQAEVLNDRLQALSVRRDLEGSFDLVSMRAVRGDAELWLSLARLAKPGAVVLWFRGSGESLTAVDGFALETRRELMPGSELVLLRRNS